MNIEPPPCSRSPAMLAPIAVGRTSNTWLGIAFAKPDRTLNEKKETELALVSMLQHGNQQEPNDKQ